MPPCSLYLFCYFSVNDKCISELKRILLMSSKLLQWPTKNRRFLWIAVFIFWTFIAIIFSVQQYIVASQEGAYPGWLKLLSFNLPSWWFWMALMPVIIWLADKFQIRRSQNGMFLIVHFFASIAVAFIHEILFSSWYYHIFFRK